MQDETNGTEQVAGGHSEATLDSSEMPALFHAADTASVKSRASFMGVVKAQVGFLLLGAVSGTVATAANVEELALVGVAAFVAVAALRVYARLSSLEASWYDARLAAESVKSLTWRYAVGGTPFGIGEVPDKEADKLFIKRMWELLAELRALHAPPARDEHHQITPGMRALRAAPLDRRKTSYERERVGNQADWYADRARRNESQATFWDVMFVLASAVAILFGLLQAIDVISVNVLGIAGFTAALITMWTGVQRYDRQARAYGITAHELLAMESIVSTIESEDEWRDFIDDAEGAVSEEHSSWRVSRARA